MRFKDGLSITQQVDVRARVRTWASPFHPVGVLFHPHTTELPLSHLLHLFFSIIALGEQGAKHLKKGFILSKDDFTSPKPSRYHSFLSHMYLYSDTDQESQDMLLTPPDYHSVFIIIHFTADHSYNYYYDFFKINLFIYFWLRWVFIAVHGLSLVAVSGGYSSLWCAGFSWQWLLSLRSIGSRFVGFSNCGSQALELRLSSCGTQRLVAQQCECMSCYWTVTKMVNFMLCVFHHNLK